MHLLIKVVISVSVILTATAVAKKLPGLGGLIAVMPLTGALVMVWVYLENRGDAKVMSGFAKGAAWGILPSLLFFITAFLCFKKALSLPAVLAVSFAVWGLAALVHQLLLP